MKETFIFVVAEAELFGEYHYLFVAKSKKAAEKELRNRYPKLWLDKENNCFQREKNHPMNIFVLQEPVLE